MVHSLIPIRQVYIKYTGGPRVPLSAVGLAQGYGCTGFDLRGEEIPGRSGVYITSFQ